MNTVEVSFPCVAVQRLNIPGIEVELIFLKGCEAHLVKELLNLDCWASGLRMIDLLGEQRFSQRVVGD